VLVPAGVFVAVQAAPLARGADGLAADALVLALLALAAALAGRDGEPLLDRATAALAVLALAALMGPGGTRGAGLLLASGATLAGAALGLVGSAVATAFMGRRAAGWYARASPPATPGEDAVRH